MIYTLYLHRVSVTQQIDRVRRATGQPARQTCCDSRATALCEDACSSSGPAQRRRIAEDTTHAASPRRVPPSHPTLSLLSKVFGDSDPIAALTASFRWPSHSPQTAALPRRYSPVRTATLHDGQLPRPPRHMRPPTPPHASPHAPILKPHCLQPARHEAAHPLASCAGRAHQGRRHRHARAPLQPAAPAVAPLARCSGPCARAITKSNHEEQSPRNHEEHGARMHGCTRKHTAKRVRKPTPCPRCTRKHTPKRVRTPTPCPRAHAHVLPACTRPRPARVHAHGLPHVALTLAAPSWAARRP
mmetsp:Transcript_74184/g.222957  ORF Transcript_74184/g.222957 Transcript_74184/m.222957 type:complete len:301 (-) Transcript_74184:651-1553(-)